ncbi:MFS transporter [Burkholderia sp. S171]|uniref:MFS transporter n=1 Tax=Burkholderia sp. S171 TaxID=1641860 RepID=UPI00131B997C|nr:MFS transporter [Burkholderia sp. S171]
METHACRRIRCGAEPTALARYLLQALQAADHCQFSAGDGRHSRAVGRLDLSADSGHPVGGAARNRCHHRNQLASATTAIYSIGTIIGYLILPFLADRYGRRPTLAAYYATAALFLVAGFGWAFYFHAGLVPFMALSFFIGLDGGNAAMYALWLPEQYPTSIRATAFAFPRR